MSTLTTVIVIAFILGYALIALEGFTKVNKAAIALLMFVVCWTLFMIDPLPYMGNISPGEVAAEVNNTIEKFLGSAGTTLFFLMGAMTIVEIVDQNGGFNFVRDALRTNNKRKLLWRIVFITFFLSAILDNMTTSIVMIMVLRKLVAMREDRMLYSAAVIIAANSGGAFSPIGDVTTIMLWNKNLITSQGVITEIFFPSLVSALIPTLCMNFMFKGELTSPDLSPVDDGDEFTRRQRRIIFALGVGGLIFVPIFKSITHLPPFVGILLVLGVLWFATELFYRSAHRKGGGMQKRVSNVLRKIDMTTILFFLGILMAVSCLEQIGVLQMLGDWLNKVSLGDHYIVTGAIGILSSIVDNVPLVAGCMGMYTNLVGDFACDGLFWQLLAYCAGVGGSILIIGSAAGVVVMGLEKISFGWYMKHISWLVIVGYIAGILCYALINSFVR